MTALLVIVVVLPVAGGLAVWSAAPPASASASATAGRSERAARVTIGVAGSATLVAALAVALAAALTEPRGALRWGAGLRLELVVSDVARAPVVLVPVVGLAVVAYAAAAEEPLGLRRLVGLLVAFVGAMQLVLVAGDLVTLLLGWELVGAVSWGLIAHDWRTDAPAAAAHAFNVTRLGDLGLFVAAGAAYAGTGSLSFSGLGSLGGAWRHAFVAGVVVAALAKSAQLPFSPWLFSAMAGPTPASALLHAATMVAAGAYLLARLEPVLSLVGWFAPLVATVGLATALAGGLVAALQSDAKRLLAASTSAHYGLMLVAVAAGFPAVAIAHLVAHGLFKALLFLAAGVAIHASGSHELSDMRLGRVLPTTAGLAAVGSLALAGVPPLGGGWTKEQVVTAGVHLAPVAGLAVVVAGGLSAYYAARFQLLAFGPGPGAGPGRPRRRPGLVEHAALAWLAAPSVALAVLWLPPGRELVARTTGGEVPHGSTWEVALSLAVVAVGAYAGWSAVRAPSSTASARPAGAPALRRPAADWLGLPSLSRRVLVDPALGAARLAARVDDLVLDAVPRAAGRLAARASVELRRGDDRVVDGGVRAATRFAAALSRAGDRVTEVSVDGLVTGLGRLVGTAGRDARRGQTGRSHHYYALVAVGVAVLVAATALWR